MRISTALPVILLSLVCSLCRAEVTLVSSRDVDGVRTVSLSYLPRAGGIEGERVESVLLGGEWETFAASSPIAELRPARVGPYSGLQVILTPIDADEPVTVEISGRVKPAQKAAPPASVQRLFLTPPETSSAASRKGLPQPAAPGTTRLTVPDAGGLVRIAAADLGLSIQDLPSARFVHHGVALSNIATASGDLVLYVPNAATLTSISDAVFVTPDAPTPSPVMGTRPAFTTLTSQGIEQPLARSLKVESNLVYDRSSFALIGERFLIHGASSGQTRTITVPFSDRLTTTTVVLTAEVHGRNVSNANPDHYASFSLNGVPTTQMSWEGRTAGIGTWSLTLPSPFPTLPLTINHSVPAGSPFDGGTDLQGLEAITLTWTGLPRLDATRQARLTLTNLPAPRLVTVGGFPVGTTADDVLVVALADPPIRVTDPALFADSDGGIAVEFEVPSGTTEVLVALLPSVAAPEAVNPVVALPDPAALTAPLRTIFVRPASLAATLAPLVASRGSGVLELDPQAAYDHFGHGQESPEAIRDALAWIIDSAPSHVPFPEVLLVGHASIDRKNYLGNQSGAQVPTFLELGVVQSLDIQNENPIDAPYGLLFGDDEFLDAAVARLPARTATDLAPMVDRILAWDAAAPTIAEEARQALFVIDDDTVFQGDMPLWTSLWSATERTSQVLNVDPVIESGGQDGLAEKAVIKAALEDPNGGRSLVMFMGHGTSDRWSGHRILQSSDIAGIDTQGRWPIVATFTCLNGLYASATPAPPCLSETWLLTPNRGALASIAPSGVDVYSTQRLFPELMLNLIQSDAESRPATVGEWMMQTQNQFALRYPLVSRTARELLLFGDPASPLALGAVEVGGADGWMMY